MTIGHYILFPVHHIRTETERYGLFPSMSGNKPFSFVMLRLENVPFRCSV